MSKGAFAKLMKRGSDGVEDQGAEEEVLWGSENLNNSHLQQHHTPHELRVLS